MKTALVIGAAGFVGRHLTPKLMAAGYQVCNVDPKVGMSFDAWLSWSPTSQKRFDVVFHLGANILDVDKRMKQGPEAYADIALDLAVARWITEFPPYEAFVWPTSCAVDNLADPYAFVKVAGEEIFGSLESTGIRTVMLRPFSGYGTEQALSYPFPAILQRAVRHENPLEVWGSGHQVRDFVHIDDLTDAFMMAIDKFPAYEPIDIGTGMGTSFIELATMMADEVGYATLITGLSAKTESSPSRIANIDRAMQFGFEAKISIEEGIRRAVWATYPRLQGREA